MTDRTPDKISALFDDLASVYDRNNDIISLFTHRIIKRQAVGLLPAKVPDNAKILDICAGTGDLTDLLARRYGNAKVIGGDFSLSMLNLARKKHSDIEFIKADCLNLPFAPNSFDIVTAGFGLRNTADYDKALSEISRVLKDGGLFLHLDFGVKNGVADFVFKALTRLTGKMQKNESYNYLLESRAEFPTPEVLAEMCENRGLQLRTRKDWLFHAISAQVYGKNY